MSITIHWLIDQTAMPGFHLLAGSTENAIAITGINIMDNPDTIPWLTKGALILSTGYFMASGDLSSHLIRDLKERGCSGFGIKMNRYLNELPREMIEQARELQFPIIGIPYSSSMDQIANLIYRKLYEEEMSETAHIALTYRELTECVLKKKSLSSLLRIIENKLETTIFLTNDTFEVLAHIHTKEDKLSFPYDFGRNSYTLFSESDVLYLKNKFSLQPYPVLTHDVSCPGTVLHFILFPIRNKDLLLGYLIFLEGTMPFTADKYNFAANLDSIFGLAMMNHSVLNEAERSSKEIFFHSLLLGNLKKETEIEPLCTQNGFDFKQYRFCMVFKIDTYEKMSIPKRRAFERKVFSVLDDALSELSFLVTHTVFQTHFVVFFLSDQALRAKEAALLGLKIAGSCRKALLAQDIPASFGTGKYARGALTIHSCYQQAFRALEIGPSLHPDSNCFSYYEDQIYHLLQGSFTSEQLTGLYQEHLGILEAFDKANNSNLLETLECYLNHALNVSQTAKSLFIHRNTMFYRLDQIKELLQVDFNAPGDCYQLKTGFYIRKLLFPSTL
jgi:purine catabolism regulator